MGSAIALVFAIHSAAPAASTAEPRLEAITRRGFLVCGVDPRVPGFAAVDAQSRYSGLDVDICRALAAAIFGTPEKVHFVQAASVAEFVRTSEIDIVSRRLTWELRREAPFGLLFGPVMFYDGQGFLVSKRLGARTMAQLAGVPICVGAASAFEVNLSTRFAAARLPLKTTVLKSAEDFDDVRQALAAGRCTAYTADVSELGAIRSRLPRPADFDILGEQISREPLAQLVRQDDAQFFGILRWTIFALINAEELGISSKNVEAMTKSENLDVQRLLGVVPGNGKALGLDEAWAYHVIKEVGNYGELFQKNVGRDSPLGLDRGLNRLARDGGLMFAPPLR